MPTHVRLHDEPRPSMLEGGSRVVTIVLNTNRREDTLECLASLAAQTRSRDNHIIVLDNRSQDGSIDAVRASFPETTIIPLQTDRGYAGNNNVGIRAALKYRPDWMLILNEDTILDAACLERMLAVGDSSPTIGFVGPMVFHHDEPNVIQSAGGRLGRFWESIHSGANEEDRAQFADVRNVDWISGCAMLVRRSLIEQIGMLDERFYYYWEETEWCVRATRSGWRIVHAPAARLWHKGVKRDYKPGPNVTYYNTRNRFLLMSKHGSPAIVRIVAWLQTLRTLTSWTTRAKWRTSRAHRDAMWQGVVDYLLGRWGARST